MPSKTKKKTNGKYFENLQAQELLQEAVQESMEEMSALGWLGSESLLCFLKKLAFDCHTTALVLLLCIISVLWLLLRYARIKHPGSKALRIGHNRLLAALSGGGKNCAMRLVQRCAMNACDIMAIDAAQFKLWAEQQINAEQEVIPQDDDEKFEAMRRRIQSAMSDEWQIDFNHESQIFSLQRLKDETRLFVNGTTLHEMLQQNANLHGMCMWFEVEYSKARNKLNGDENTLLLLWHDKVIASSKAGQVSKKGRVEKNQAVSLLSGTLQDACEMHDNKSAGGAANRTSILFCGPTEDDGIKRAANIVSDKHERFLTFAFVQVLRLALCKEEDEVLVARVNGIISKFETSIAMNEGVNYYKERDHIEGINLSDDILVENKEESNDNILWIKPECAGSSDYWYSWHNLESGAPHKMLPSDMKPILRFVDQKPNYPHLNTRITVKYADYVQALQLLFKLERYLEPMIIPERGMIYDETDLIFTSRAARAASRYMLLEREFNQKLYHGVSVITSLSKWDLNKARLKLFGDNNNSDTSSRVNIVVMECDEPTAIKKIIIFCTLDESSKINKCTWVKNIISSPSPKVKKAILELTDKYVITYKRKEKVNTWVAENISVNKIADLEATKQIIALNEVDNIINSPRHRSQKELTIDWPRFCELSDDSIEWINNKLQTL